MVAQGGSGYVAAAVVVVVGRGGRGGRGVLVTGQGNTVFLYMLPWVLVQQVSYTLAREGAYSLTERGGGGPSNLGLLCESNLAKTSRFSALCNQEGRK